MIAHGAGVPKLLEPWQVELLEALRQLPHLPAHELERRVVASPRVNGYSARVQYVDETQLWTIDSPADEVRAVMARHADRLRELGIT